MNLMKDDGCNTLNISVHVGVGYRITDLPSMPVMSSDLPIL
jgi:hypothetical protein